MVLLLCSAIQSFALPTCTGSPAKEGDKVSSWTNCKGTYTNADGSKYVGEYRNSRRHGQGTYIWAGGDKYVGEFKNGKPHGQGTYTFANGLKYVGDFQNNYRHGQGRYIADGKTYSGTFVNGGLTGKVGLKFYSRTKNTSNSQWRIGNIYAGGLGVPKDLHKAVEHYSKAASKGHAKSKSALNSMRTKHERTAIERIVKKYCKNQVAEKSLKELLPKQKRKRAKWF